MKFLIATFLIITLGCFLLLAVMHEFVHVAIYNSYGVKSHVEYFSHFPDFVTITEDSANCTESCTLAHNLNEAVSYPLEAFYMFFAGVFLVIIIYLDKIFEEVCKT